MTDSNLTMRSLVLPEAIKFFAILLLIPQSFAHYDSAYFHSYDDRFNERPKWMSDIRDDVKLSELAIPGTHNSAGWNATIDYMDTQCINFQSQLEYGIRFFRGFSILESDISMTTFLFIRAPWTRSGNCVNF